jgi:Tfp pilus assembly protein PilF
VRLTLAAALPALVLTVAIAADGAGQAPPNLGAAIAEQRNLVSARPGDAGVWNDLGNLLVMSGSFDEAESAYGRALELDPVSVQARFNRGLLCQQRGDLDGAVADYHELLDIEPRHAWALYQLGAAYEALDLRELALESYASAFTIDPELLFAENNPHIIENRLVTEALLRARRGSRSGPPAPRAYDEEARINSILTPSPPPPPVAPAAARPDDDPDSASRPATGAAADSGAVVRDQISRGAPRRSQSKAPLTAPAAGSPEDRVLTSNDLRGSVRNQVRGEAEGTGGPATASSRRRSAAAMTPHGARQPSVSQPPAIDTTFGFGQRSTGALEWKLGPASDEPVPAR